MARIQGVPQAQAGPIVKLVYRVMRKGMKKMTTTNVGDYRLPGKPIGGQLGISRVLPSALISRSS
jgi:hypothetical protein